MTTEVKEQPAKRPYVAPVLERIELAVNTQAGAIAGVADGGATSTSFKAGS
jgi:hypothetical protein